MQPKRKKKKKVLFVELNEFNFELLQTSSIHWGFKNIQKVLALHLTQTRTEDLYESDYLEPWVQWVSVHTGTPSSEHQIKHLGDVPELHTEQIWEKLSKEGITSGIWGAMNSSRNQAENCLFFLPDPWTVSESAYPSELNTLLDLLRYSTKNYLNTSQIKILNKVGKLILFLTKKGLFNAFRKEISNLIKFAKEFKGESFVYISLFDYFSTLLFLKIKKEYNPDFSLLFLNSLAHLQHHHWHRDNIQFNKRFHYGLQYLDRVFQEIFNHLEPQDTLIVANALSQTNTNDEAPWILYRQKDQTLFLQKIGLRFLKVEAHMTHDAHIFFHNKEECLEAQKILREVSIEGHPLFHVESYSSEPLKIFYKIIFTDKIPLDAHLVINQKRYPFFDLFQSVVQRTGKHIQTAHMLSNKDSFPKKIQNHEIFDCIYQLFQEDLQPVSSTFP